jgi:hypothetical protein
LVCGVAFDYTNYDARPPSVKLVNPFTVEPYATKNLPTTLPRAVPATPPIGGFPPGVQPMAIQTMMQPAPTPEGIPFLCHPGVREYHDHPAHSGDAWEHHRADGAGRLVRLLDLIWRYGVTPLSFNLSVSVNLAAKADAIQP